MQTGYPRLWSILCVALSFYPAFARAGSTKRTIDDELGDSTTGVKPSYSPASGWKQGNPCGCDLNIEDAFQTTWHDATQQPGDGSPRSITLKFAGTAVYVYNTLADARVVLGRDTMTTTYVSLTFDIDGAHAGDFFQANVRGIRYKYRVFSQEGLKDGPHTLKISVVPPTNSQSWSVALFDYVEYVASDSDTALPPPAPQTSSTMSAPNTPASTSTSTRTTSTTSDGTPAPPLSAPTTSTQNQSLTDTGHFPSTPSAPAPSTSSTSTDPGLQSSPSATPAAASTSNAPLKARSVAAIAGAAAGGTIVLVVAGCFVYQFVRRRRRYRGALRSNSNGGREQSRRPTRYRGDLSPPRSPRAPDSDPTTHEVTPFSLSLAQSRHSSKRGSGARSRRAEPSAYSTSESSTSTQALLDTRRRTRVPSGPNAREAGSTEDVRLRAQVAALEQEMTRMAALEREMERMRELVEAPPEYELPETRTGEEHAI